MADNENGLPIIESDKFILFEILGRGDHAIKVGDGMSPYELLGAIHILKESIEEGIRLATGNTK